ncbi:sensor histidine kinase [Paenibacillus macerans]|uniref:sensor histidine kinase n=1 Tax=Paenibacillus macerans TaxID=44252 RepID=UPI003D318128
MKKENHVRNDRNARGLTVLLLVSLVIAYILAYTLCRMTASLMGYEELHRPTFAFLILVLLIWIVFLLLIGRYTRVQPSFKTKLSKKETMIGGIVLTLATLAIMIGCGALAGLFTQIIYFTLGHVPAKESIYRLGLNGLIWLTLLWLVRSYLKRGNVAKYIDLVAAVIRVLESIASGDYKARLEVKFNENESFGELVNSVNNMAADLEQMENMRQEFISNVSHEIQSPLASIRGFAQVLQSSEQASPEEAKIYLGIIETESARLSKLSDNLLQLTVLESESMKLERRPYRLDKQLRDLILASEPQWRSKRIGMEASLNEAICTLDEDRMSQVWTNLIHNSIKFTPEGGKVRVELHQHGANIEVHISDTGIGISEEDQQRVFERFYKADKSREHSTKGSGLGLSIVNKIVDLHGGGIRLRSQPGAGTTITVFLSN